MGILFDTLKSHVIVDRFDVSLSNLDFVVVNLWNLWAVIPFFGVFGRLR